MKFRLRPIVSYTLLFVEAVSLFLLTFLVLLKINLFNSGFIIRQLEKNHYYDSLYNNIKTRMSYYIAQSGFKDSIIDDTFSVADVKSDTNMFVKDLYSGKSSKFNTDSLKNNFKVKIDKYISDKHLKINKNSDITDFINKMSDVYVDEIMLNNYFNFTSSGFSNILSCSSLFIVLFLFNIVFLSIINFKIFRRTNLAVLFFTSGFLFLVASVYIGCFNISSISIYNDLISNVVKGLFSNVFVLSIVFVFINFVVGFVLSVLFNEKKVYDE